MKKKIEHEDKVVGDNVFTGNLEWSGPCADDATSLYRAIEVIQGWDKEPNVTADVKEVAKQILEMDSIVLGSQLETAYLQIYGTDLGISKMIMDIGDAQKLPEFQNVHISRCQILFTKAVISEKDSHITLYKMGRVSVVPKIERQLNPMGPLHRIVISLPYWICATRHEKAAAIHSLLCCIGYTGDDEGFDLSPIIRKPVSMFAATLGRYGVTNVFEAQAIAQVVRRKDHIEQLTAFHFDPKSQQGNFWAPLLTGPCRQPEEKAEES